MELKEAIEILGAFKLVNIIEILTQGEFEDVKTAIDTVLEELENRIPKEILEEYLTQAEERYKTYKKASEENEGCKGGMWRYLGQVDLLKRILGKSINVVTLDKE